MQITVTTNDGGVFPLDIGSDLTLQDLQALLELETGINKSELLLVHNMAPLTEAGKTLGEYGVEEGDVIVASRMEGGVLLSNPSPLPQPPPPSQPFPIDWSTISITPAGPNEQGHPQRSTPGQVSSHHQGQHRQHPPRDPDDPEVVRQHFLNNPHELSLLQQRNPALAEALLSGDRERFRNALERQRNAIRDAERERIRMLNADPLDPEYQAKIAQDIQQKNIEENMEAAIEYTPESFSRVVMLYLEIKVNGVPVKALVDSGARATIMSRACAERCNIMRLVDQRFAGMAFGVGQQRIIGRVHLGQIQIGRDFLTSSFQVLESAAEDMLLGLDMLRRHQCCIDLKENCLRIGTTGTSTPFLTEKDLKEKEEMEKKQMEASMQTEDFEMAQAIANSEQTDEGETKTKRPKVGTSSSPHPHSSPSSTAQPSQAPPSTQSFPEEAIQQITAAGFSREEAIHELRVNGGSVQLALTALLARSITL